MKFYALDFMQCLCDVLHLLSTHFGDAWNSVTYPIVQREIAEALEADTAVIGG